MRKLLRLGVLLIFTECFISIHLCQCSEKFDDSKNTQLPMSTIDDELGFKRMLSKNSVEKLQQIAAECNGGATPKFFEKTEFVDFIYDCKQKALNFASNREHASINCNTAKASQLYKINDADSFNEFMENDLNDRPLLIWYSYVEHQYLNQLNPGVRYIYSQKNRLRLAEKFCDLFKFVVIDCASDSMLSRRCTNAGLTKSKGLSMIWHKPSTSKACHCCIKFDRRTTFSEIDSWIETLLIDGYYTNKESPITIQSVVDISSECSFCHVSCNSNFFDMSESNFFDTSESNFLDTSESNYFAFLITFCAILFGGFIFLVLFRRQKQRDEEPRQIQEDVQQQQRQRALQEQQEQERRQLLMQRLQQLLQMFQQDFQQRDNVPDVDEQAYLLAKEALNETCTYRKDTDETCSICQNDIVDGCEIYNIKCRHLYHAECIHLWVFDNKQHKCPNCNTDIMAPDIQ